MSNGLRVHGEVGDDNDWKGSYQLLNLRLVVVRLVKKTVVELVEAFVAVGAEVVLAESPAQVQRLLAVSAHEVERMEFLGPGSVRREGSQYRTVDLLRAVSTDGD